MSESRSDEAGRFYTTCPWSETSQQVLFLAYNEKAYSEIPLQDRFDSVAAVLDWALVSDMAGLLAPVVRKLLPDGPYVETATYDQCRTSDDIPMNICNLDNRIFKAGTNLNRGTLKVKIFYNFVSLAIRADRSRLIRRDLSMRKSEKLIEKNPKEMPK